MCVYVSKLSNLCTEFTKIVIDADEGAYVTRSRFPGHQLWSEQFKTTIGHWRTFTLIYVTASDGRIHLFYGSKKYPHHARGPALTMWLRLQRLGRTVGEELLILHTPHAAESILWPIRRSK